MGTGVTLQGNSSSESEGTEIIRFKLLNYDDSLMINVLLLILRFFVFGSKMRHHPTPIPALSLPIVVI